MSTSEKFRQANDNPQGADDARPTAMQILKEEGLEGRLGDVTVIVTGANSGIGLETAKVMHAAGCEVVMPVRNQSKGEEALEQIKESNAGREGAGSLKLMDLDLASLDSVRQFAKAFKEQHTKLNLLINNAGIMACPEGTTQDGFETQFGTNHLAHFLLFMELKDLLLQSSTPSFASRVVCLSSVGHRSSSVCFDDLDFKKQGYSPFVAYGQSKTANIWMANEIERRYGSQGLHALSVHPGGIMTNLGRYMPPGAMEQFMQDERLRKMLKSPPQGAATTVWAAISKELEGRGGLYLEECHVAERAPEKEGLSPADQGYAAHAYDEAGEKRLWEVSCKMVGVDA